MLLGSPACQKEGDNVLARIIGAAIGLVTYGLGNAGIGWGVPGTRVPSTMRRQT